MSDDGGLSAAVEHLAFAADRLALVLERIADSAPRQAARDVAPGRTWYFLNHRNMHQVIEAG